MDENAMARFRAQAEEAKRNLPEEDLIFLMPGVHSERVRAVDRLATNLFYAHRSAALPQILAALKQLEMAEHEVQARFESAFSRGRGSGELSFFESYGIPWDYEVSGLAGGLLFDFDAAWPLLDEERSEKLVARMRARCPSYAVNHVDCVVARYLLRNDQFKLAGARSDFEGGLGEERVRALTPIFTLQKTGRNDDPLKTKLTLTAKLGPPAAPFLGGPEIGRPVLGLQRHFASRKDGVEMAAELLGKVEHVKYESTTRIGKSVCDR